MKEHADILRKMAQDSLEVEIRHTYYLQVSGIVFSVKQLDLSVRIEKNFMFRGTSSVFTFFCFVRLKYIAVLTIHSIQNV